MRSLLPNRFPKLGSFDIDFLGRMVTDEEIKNALFDMAPFKAPSNDDFHVHFFQK